MVKVLVSACLLGAPVRYNGRDKRCEHPVLARWLAEGRVVSACPEVLGGLGTPRPPSEIVRLDGRRRVMANDRRDVTTAFETGAAVALQETLRSDVRIALLKEGSPSCGTTWVYDGTFTGTRVPGEGVAASLLRSRGVRVFSEAQIEEADAAVAELEKNSRPRGSSDTNGR